MKKIFTLLALMVAIAASADFRTIDLDDNLDVREILKTDTMTLDSLKVKGYLNHHNLYFISWMTNRKLEYIDLSECTLQNNEIPNEGLNPTIFVYNTTTGLYYSQLKEVKFPATLKSIGDWAMAATRLEKIDIPESVDYIGAGAFHSCKHLTGAVNLPEGLTTIAPGLLYYCPYVESVSLPSTTEVIGSDALGGLIFLHEINMPSGLREIGVQGCSGWYDFYGDIVLPATLEKMDYFAFRCSRLNSLKFEAGSKLKVIPNEAFRSSYIKELSLPDHLETISSYAFSDCRFTEVEFPSTLTKISEWAFGQCDYLNMIVLNENLKQIGNYAFGYCPNLTDVYVKATITPEICKSTFDNPELMKLYVPVGAREAYAAAEYWKDFGEIVEVEEFPSAGREAVIAASEAVRAFGAFGAAVIEGDGCRYTIYAADGRMVAAGTANGRTEVALPRGIYIVDTAGGAHRIAVR